MSCKHKRGYPYLDVESEISRQGCKYSPGASADHAVMMISYAVFEVEVGFHCGCPNGALSYPNGYDWDPDPVTLLGVGVGRGPQSFTFHQNLEAGSTVAHLPRSEQLKLEPRRRKLPAGPPENLRVLPIDVTVE